MAAVVGCLGLRLMPRALVHAGVVEWAVMLRGLHLLVQEGRGHEWKAGIGVRIRLGLPGDRLDRGGWTADTLEVSELAFRDDGFGGFLFEWPHGAKSQSGTAISWQAAIF